MTLVSDINRLRSSSGARRLLQLRFKGNEKALLSALDAEMNRLLRTDLNRAGRFVKKVEHLYGFIGAPLKARLTAMTARLNLWQGDHASALVAYRKAQTQFRKNCNFVDAAKTGVGLLDVYMYLGRYEEALDVGRASLRYFRQRKMDFDAARVLISLGNVYHRRDDSKRALACYDKAREVFVAKGGVPLAIAEYNRGNILTNLNQLRSAQGTYKRAGEIYNKQKMVIAEGQVTCALAYLCYLRSQFTDAITLLEQANKIFLDQGDRRSAAIAQVDLVEVYLELNQCGSVIATGRHLMDEFRALKMRYEEGKTAYFMSRACLKLKDFNRATYYLRSAKRIFSSENNRLWSGIVTLLEARIALAGNRRKVAREVAVRAKHCFTRSDDERRAQDANILLLEIDLSDRPERSHKAQINRLRAKRMLAYQELELNRILGEHYLRQQDYREGLKAFRKAVQTLEVMLSGLYPDEIRFFFVADKYHIYQRLVECLLHVKSVDAAFLANIQGLASLYDLKSSNRQLKKKVPKELLVQQEELRSALRQLNREPSGSRRLEPRLQRQSAIEQKLWSNERRVRAYLYTPGVSHRIVKPDAMSLTRLTGQSQVFISYTLVDGKPGVFWSDGKKASFEYLPVSNVELNDIIRKLHFLCEREISGFGGNLNSETAISHFLNRLYDVLVKPLARAFDSELVQCAVEGPFCQIPLVAVLNTGEPDWSQCHRLNLVLDPASAPISPTAKLSLSTRQNSILALASGQLPAVDIEAHRIADQFSSASLYINDRATVSQFVQELKTCDGFIHLATHASRSSENPLFSPILMHDGPFYPFDLFGQGLTAQLVTLSGCQTAAPGLYYGNSFSLATAFHRAGARFVLATLWPVSDRMTMYFMSEFYVQLKKSDDVWQAYHVAMNSTRNLVDNPAFWAPFILIGT